ncbi:MAG: family 20 glycosylhydrolase [Lentisphaeria bacterium]|nr:family 20 glycosylhydrolase [Lentisphaeria bacterium]
MGKKQMKTVWTTFDPPGELVPLLRTLAEEYPIKERGDGPQLKFRRISGKETVSAVIRSGNEAVIEYSSISAAARGLGTLLAGMEGENRSPFAVFGIMLDVSRNMVMTVDHLKRWLRRLALAGCNTLMLYCEDTYVLEGEPFFGYMRGPYSFSDIRELDRYARSLGIELIGCIETLGHLEQILKWEQYGSIKDTRSVMLADEDATYALIEKMIRFWSDALGSRRIHIGMDETHDLGRGAFLDRHGYERGFDIFNRHLAKVNEICRKYGLMPMLWSDMYFRMANPRREYYDSTCEIPEDVRKAIPGNAGLVYWDYYHADAESYEKMIRRHREMGFEPVVASGIWTWPTLWYDHEMTARTIVPCLEACRREKVRELFFTLWGDDGAFCNIDSALAGIFYAADQVFGETDRKRTARRFNVVCGPTDYDAHLTAAKINARFPSPDGGSFKVFSSYLIWDDPLLGIALDGYSRKNPDFCRLMGEILDEILENLPAGGKLNGAGDLEFAADVAVLLKRKLELRRSLLAAYERKDRQALLVIAGETIPATVKAAERFDKSFRRQWMRGAKPFGLERIQARNAAQISRLRETAVRIREYVSGQTERIDELECRLGPEVPAKDCYALYELISAGTCII